MKNSNKINRRKNKLRKQHVQLQQENDIQQSVRDESSSVAQEQSSVIDEDTVDDLNLGNKQQAQKHKEVRKYQKSNSPKLKNNKNIKNQKNSKKNKKSKTSWLQILLFLIIFGFLATMIFFAFNQEKLLASSQQTLPIKQNVQMNRNNQNLIKSQSKQNQVDKRIIEKQSIQNANNKKSSIQIVQIKNQQEQSIKINTQVQVQKIKNKNQQSNIHDLVIDNQETKNIQEQIKPQNINIQEKPSQVKQQADLTSNQKLKIDQNHQNKQLYRVRQKFRQKIPPSITGRDRYEFTVSIQNVVSSSPVRNMFTTSPQQSGIKRPSYQRAIRLMEIVHNINIQGQFVFDHFNFYQSAQQKYKAFQQILNEQKLFYDRKYQINKYWHDQIGMCVYIPSYNTAQNSRLYLRALDSVFQQDYKNYHIVFVNDFSTDKTGEYAQNYMQVNKIPSDKYVIINNDKRKLNSQNSYIVGNKYCNLGEIMIMLDGDDALVGRQVFSLLNAIYRKQKVALTYGTYLWVGRNSATSGYSTMDIPQYALQQGTYRKLGVFYASHLKTMYVDVFRQINITDFQYADGRFLDFATDVIFMTPGIQLVGTRLKFIREILYEYNYNTGLNQPANQQRRVELFIYTKPAYKKMLNMDFADNPKTINYP